MEKSFNKGPFKLKYKVTGMPLGEKLVGVAVALVVALWLAVGVSWCVNVYKLVTCDWDNNGSWKGEIVHGIGLVPGASLFTVWNTDK